MSTVREPRAIVVANGMTISQIISVEIHSSGAFQADQFRADIAVSAENPTSIAWWDAQGSIDVDFQLSAGGGYVRSILRGQVDRLDIDPVMRLVRIEGRDLSARLIDTPTDMSYANQTASEIASQIAQRHGLNAVIAPSSGLSGRYYGNDHSQVAVGRLAHMRSEWDLLDGIFWRNWRDRWDIRCLSREQRCTSNRRSLRFPLSFAGMRNQDC